MGVGRRFWTIENAEEGQVIERVLRRRFPYTFSLLSEILEISDPLDVVYPGNPDEYSDVVREIIVLLAPIDGNITLLSTGQIRDVLKDGLGRCFDDEPIEDRVQAAADQLSVRAR